jgi:membrane associated rhomboid family serine protease
MKSSGYYLPSVTKTNKIIMISVVAVFVLNHLLGAMGAINLVNLLGVSGVQFKHGLIFQPFTYFLVEKSFFSAIFNLLMLWFMGSDLESRFGLKIYLKILAVSILVPGFLYALLGGFVFPNTPMGYQVLIGLTGVNFTFCVAQAALEPDRIFSFFFVFPMRAVHFVFLLVLIELYMIFLGGGLYMSWVHLLSMAMGWMIIKGQKNALIHWYFTDSPARVKKPKPSKHLKLIKPEDKDNPPKYWQ